tara:strand:- start:444 stop:1043 length:600 start_codon:yes stop_codon:yes gene_type:complete
MADSKISALPASSTPLAGTEVLPIVQSSTTKQVSVANLTAGRAISATEITLTTGNVIVASGQGIDFSAVVHSGSSSKLLNDYEIGNWTPTDGSGASLSFSSANGKYTKIGRAVFVEFRVTYPSTVSASNAVIAGLPFTNNNNDRDNVPVNILSSGAAVSGMFNQGGADFGISTIGTFTSITNATLSTITLRGSGWYVTA